MDQFILKDINGNSFIIDALSLYQQLQDGNFKLFGFDMPTILELRRQYMMKCGPIDASPKTVSEAFNKTA